MGPLRRRVHRDRSRLRRHDRRRRARPATAAATASWTSWVAPDRARRSSLSLSASAHGCHRTGASCLLTCGNTRCQPAGWGADTGTCGGRRPSGPGDPLQPGEFSFRLWQSNRVRSIVALVAALLGAGVLAAPPALAGPTVCDYPACTPGIMAHQVLGAPCDNTTYYAFGVADGYVPSAAQPGRLMFCGSPRRYEPRWFRSPPMAGIKEEGADCTPVPELRGAGARWPVSGLHRQRRCHDVGPGRHLDLVEQPMGNP